MSRQIFTLCLILTGMAAMPLFVSAQSSPTVVFETALPWYYSWSNAYWGSGSFTRTSNMAVSYKPSANQTVCTIKSGLYKSGYPADSVVLNVMEDVIGGHNSYPTAGQVIGTSTVLSTEVASAPIFANTAAYTAFAFSPCLSLTAGVNYSFIFSRTQPDANNFYVSQISNLIYYPETLVWAYAPANGRWQEMSGYEPALRLEGSDTTEPVLIVPGMLGSELANGSDLIWPDLDQMLFDINDEFLVENLGLDSNGQSIKDISIGEVAEVFLNNVPIFEINIFQDLHQLLENNNYILDKNLFFFPYDWRLNIDDSVTVLKQKIDAIKSQTGFSKINIVAHSMGGLLVKDYISQYGKNDIDKLIFVGTPHLGAPKAGKTLLAGDNFGIPWLEESAMRALSLNSPAAYELLPAPEYFDQFVGYLKKFNSSAPLDYLQTKNFILNSGANANIFDKAENFFHKNLQDVDLSGVKVYNIAGCRTGTQAGYQYAQGDSEIKEVKYTSGDQTVPLASSDYVNTPNKYYVKNGKHAELPSANGVRELILNVLKDQPVSLADNISADQSFCGFKGKELVWRSPVEVHVYDNAGRHTGPIDNNAVEYGIAGVDYEIIGHEKFIFLPTDDGQNYQVVAKGLDQGAFDLIIAANDNGSVTGATVFNDIPVNTSTTVGLNVFEDSADNSIQVDGGNGNPETVLATAHLSGSEAEDLTPPETSATLSGLAGDNGWYRSDVAVSLAAVDNNSGILETRYSLDGGVTFSTYTEPIGVSAEGASQIQYFSIDRAGNNEAVKMLEIKIDKTPPEISAEFDPARGDFVFTAACDVAQCVARDEAGNTAVLMMERIEKGNPQVRFKSVAYNDWPVIIFPANKFVVRDLNQNIVINDVERARVDYQKKKDQSVITTQLSGKKPIKETVSGVKFLQFSTKNGILNIEIK